METPTNPRLIRPKSREFDSDGEYEYQEFDLADSDLRVHLNHQPDGKTALVVEREGEEQASIIADADDRLRAKTHD